MKGDGRRGFSLDSAAMRIVAPAAFAVVVLALWQLYAVVSDVPESDEPQADTTTSKDLRVRMRTLVRSMTGYPRRQGRSRRCSPRATP